MSLDRRLTGSRDWGMLPHKRRLEDGFLRLRPVKVSKQHIAFASRDANVDFWYCSNYYYPPVACYCWHSIIACLNTIKNYWKKKKKGKSGLRTWEKPDYNICCDTL